MNSILMNFPSLDLNKFYNCEHLTRKRCCGVVVITLVLHTKGPQFDPGQHHLFLTTTVFLYI